MDLEKEDEDEVAYTYFRDLEIDEKPSDSDVIRMIFSILILMNYKRLTLRCAKKMFQKTPTLYPECLL